MSEADGKDPLVYIHQLTHRITRLLKALGRLGECESCHAEVYWMLTKNSKWLPYDVTGVPHFSTCPEADSWRKKKGAKEVEQRR